MYRIEPIVTLCGRDFVDQAEAKETGSLEIALQSKEEWLQTGFCQKVKIWKLVEECQK